MDNCNFCLENDRLRGEILARNDLCYLADTADPVLRHAGVIIPYRHVATPLELDADEFLATRDLMLKAVELYDTFAPDGYNIGWNVGEAAGQSVFHVHLHVIARFADEPLAGKGVRYFYKQESNRRPHRGNISRA